MNFCPRCGTPVVGAYCRVCGAPTSAVASNASDVVAPLTDETLPTMNDAQASTEFLPDSAGDERTRTEKIALKVNPSGEVVGGLPVGRARRSLVIETWVVMVAFLLPVVTSAVLILAQHIAGVVDVARFPTIVHHQPVTNMLLGILGYLPVAATVPLAFYLLARTGQDRKTLGIGRPSFKIDVWPALGIGVAAFVAEVVLLLPIEAFLQNNRSLFGTVTTTNVPKIYVIWGVVISAVTAVTEEMLVNGYLITRLSQLGWTPRKSLILSLILRTSYHVYYGLGFLLTVPFGYLVTRSFQKHHKLNRPIVAHFLFDAILFTVAILH